VALRYFGWAQDELKILSKSKEEKKAHVFALINMAKSQNELGSLSIKAVAVGLFNKASKNILGPADLQKAAMVVSTK